LPPLAFLQLYFTIFVLSTPLDPWFKGALLLRGRGVEWRLERGQLFLTQIPGSTPVGSA